MEGSTTASRTSPTAGMKRKLSHYGDSKDEHENDVKPHIDQHGSFTALARYTDGDRHGQQAREDIIPGVALNLSSGNSYSHHLATSNQKQPTRPNSTSIPSSSNIPLNISPRIIPAIPNHNAGHSSGITRPSSITPRSDPYGANGPTNGTINPNAKGLGGESRGIPHSGSGDGHHSEVSDQGHQGEKNKRKKPRVALSCAQCTKIPEQCTLYVPGEPLPKSTRIHQSVRRQSSQSASQTQTPPQKATSAKAQPPPSSANKKPPLPLPPQPTPQRSSSQAIPGPSGSVPPPMAIGAQRSSAPAHRPLAIQPQPSSASQPRHMSTSASVATETPVPRKELPALASMTVSTIQQLPATLQALANQPYQHFFPPNSGSVEAVYNASESVYEPESPMFESEVLQRLERIESIVRSSSQHPLAVNIRSGSYVKALAGEGSVHNEGSRRGPTDGDQEGRPFGFSRSASAGDGTGLDAGRWFATDGTVPSIEGLRGSSTIQLNLTDCGTPADNLQRLIQDCGVSPMKLRDLVQELPPYPFAAALVDWFFQHINYVRYPIDERIFRSAFEDMYKKKDGVGPEPGNVRSLPLIFIVLATSSRLAPEAWAGDEQTRRMTSLRMYWCSRRSLLIAIAIQPESLELVVTRLLSALYLVLIHDRRLTECWSQLGASLRTAQAIGLHRDGTKLGLDPYVTEYRRRVWSYLYHADRNYSLILGRPPSIGDAYCDAGEPSNVEFADLEPGQPIVSKPLSEPTSSTFVILRKRFAKIVGKITHHFQKLHEPARFEDVEFLDKELRNFISDLPPHYRMEDADKSLDAAQPYIPIHRYYLSTEILFIVITLHRPWLLRRLRSDRFAMSRRACFDAAKMDFRIRQQFRNEHPGVHNAYFGGQFREFNAAMIAGISAIIFPRGEDAEEMRLILTTFLNQNPLDKQAHRDQASQKEVAIIYTLCRRAQQVLERNEISNSGHRSESVALLLGLRDGEGVQLPPSSSQSTRNGGQSNESTSSIFKNLYSAMVNGNSGKNQNNAQSGISATAPYQPLSLSLPGHQRSNSFSNSTNNLTDHSPAGSGSAGSGLEDEHPQRLLDHWLSANSSMAIGHPHDADIDARVLGQAYGLFGGLNQPLLGITADHMGQGWAIPGTNGLVGGTTDPLLEEDIPHEQRPQQDTFHNISHRMAGIRAEDGLLASGDSAMDVVGLSNPVPLPSADQAVPDIANPLDDTYWNTLIDGK
ncbi:hypothetical protein QFC22_004999 [Naganishia vaughanmartiniae]|uniref:Uncharacterized protein n=1 Tax=Naganishia vaughanmartiniae TaxID=1424756 RepID=A0ACC2WXU9_9TREE|nr:hypothetical protein QFC22_004999 [Naganishia vaughanmartiniae]